jgi:hypothetical protein
MLVAFDVDQRKVADCPRSMLDGSTESVAVGLGGAGFGFSGGGGGGGGAGGGTFFLQPAAKRNNDNAINIVVIFRLLILNACLL